MTTDPRRLWQRSSSKLSMVRFTHRQLEEQPFNVAAQFNFQFSSAQLNLEAQQDRISCLRRRNITRTHCSWRFSFRNVCESPTDRIGERLNASARDRIQLQLTGTPETTGSIVDGF